MIKAITSNIENVTPSPFGEGGIGQMKSDFQQPQPALSKPLPGGRD
jgi:hypothetical protein